MSTLRVNNILDSSGGDLVNSRGIAKAWVNFNGTGTVSIRTSMNVTSLTDNGVGDYSVNFTNALSNANYVVLCSGTNDNGGWTGQANVQPKADVTRTTANTRVVSSNTISGNLADFSEVYVAVFR